MGEKIFDIPSWFYVGAVAVKLRDYVVWDCLLWEMSDRGS